jgi:hypothetical protein
MVSIQEFFLCNSHCTPVGYDLEFCIDAGSVMSLISKDLNIQNGLFQQQTRDEGKWKTTFATSHRAQERLGVSTMDLATSPMFFLSDKLVHSKIFCESAMRRAS